jgi:hypothetical protein
VIYPEIQSIIDRYKNPITIMDGLSFSQKDQLKIAEFYSNSKYLLSERDELGRIKPFYNIVNYRVTLAKTATDLDIKDFQFTADKIEHQTKAMLLNTELYEWMKRSDFSIFLNKAGYKRAKYGGVLTKTTESKGELKIDVVDWRNTYTDQTDILGNPIVEVHYMTPLELQQKEGSWDNVKEALKCIKKQNADVRREKDKINRLEVYEVHGQFPIKSLKETKGEECTEDDEFEYSQQVYFMAKIGTGKQAEEFIFFAEKEKESPYDYIVWEEMEGRALGRGVIEDSEQAQVWTNHAIINESNAMDLAGRVVMKTNSKSVGQNIFEVDNGKIFELDAGEDLNSVNLIPSALGEFQVQINRWKDQVDNATTSYDAITGERPPSGTPYSQTALLNQVASKPFDFRREEMGIFLTKLLEKRVLPYLKKRLYSKHLLVSDFSEDELSVIDQAFIGHNNKAFIDKILNEPFDAPVPTQEQYNTGLNKLISKVKGQGSRRYVEIPKGFFDGIEGKLTILTTNEQKDKATILQSLSALLQTVAGSYDPNTRQFAILSDPKLSKIFSHILEMSNITGLSPASLGLGQEIKGMSAPQQAPMMNAGNVQPMPTGEESGLRAPNAAPVV